MFVVFPAPTCCFCFFLRGIVASGTQHNNLQRKVSKTCQWIFVSCKFSLGSSGPEKFDRCSFVSSDSDKCCLPGSDAPPALLPLNVFFLCFIGLAQLRPGGGGASAERAKTSSGTPGFSGIPCAFFGGRQAIYTHGEASNWPIRDSDCFPPDQ